MREKWKNSPSIGWFLHKKGRKIAACLTIFNASYCE
jgi:hypothetical protein